MQNAYYFNPGCALSIYKPDMVGKIFAFLSHEYIGIKMHRICCRHDPCIPEGSVIINVCPGCDRRFRTLYSGISTIALWEVLDRKSDFPYPDYHGARMSIHDACPVRSQPRIHRAVRSLLAKMNISVVETEFNQTRSICCGDSFYGHIPETQIYELMRKRAASMPCDDVCVYCVSCIKSIFNGGRKPRYLPDLLFSEDTYAQEHDIVKWHKGLEAYIDRH